VVDVSREARDGRCSFVRTQIHYIGRRKSTISCEFGRGSSKFHACLPAPPPPITQPPYSFPPPSPSPSPRQRSIRAIQRRRERTRDSFALPSLILRERTINIIRLGINSPSGDPSRDPTALSIGGKGARETAATTTAGQTRGRRQNDHACARARRVKLA